MIEIPEQKTCEQIAQVACEPDEAPIPWQKVAAILAAYRNVMSGDPVGTILRNPENGAIAVRANDNGLHIWRVSVPDGSQYNDLQPTLEGWEKIG